MKKSRYLLWLLLPIALLASAGAHRDRDAASKRAKARYYFLEGARRSADGKNADAYELFKKAYAIDSTYEEAAWNTTLSQLDLLFSKDLDSDSAQVAALLNKLTGLSDYYRYDLPESRQYATLMQYLGHPEEAVRVFTRMDSIFPDNTGTLISLAECYNLLDSIEGVMQALNKYERIEGMSVPLSARKAGYLLSAGDTVRAVTEGKRFIEKNPVDAQGYCLMGNIFELANQPDSARRVLEYAEKLDSTSGAVKIALASFYQSVGDSVGFDNKIYEALLSEDYDLQDKLELLTQYLQQIYSDAGSMERGDKLFEVLGRQYPYETQLLELSASYHAAKKDWAGAAEAMSYAIDQQPDNESYWLMEIDFLGNDKRIPEAEKVYREAVEKLGESDNLRLALSQAYVYSEDYDKSIAILTGIIRRITPAVENPYTPLTADSIKTEIPYESVIDVSLYLNMIGDIDLMRERNDSAYAAYDNSLFFNPQNALVLNNYAWDLAKDSTNLDRAEEMSFRSIQIEPESPTYLDTYAWINFLKGNYTMARVYQSKAVANAMSLGMTSADIFDHYGDILFLNGEEEDALKFWELAAELDPENKLIKRKLEEKKYIREE